MSFGRLPGRIRFLIIFDIMRTCFQRNTATSLSKCLESWQLVTKITPNSSKKHPRIPLSSHVVPVLQQGCLCPCSSTMSSFIKRQATPYPHPSTSGYSCRRFRFYLIKINQINKDGARTEILQLHKLLSSLASKRIKFLSLIIQAPTYKGNFFRKIINSCLIEPLFVGSSTSLESLPTYGNPPDT